MPLSYLTRVCEGPSILEKHPRGGDPLTDRSHTADTPARLQDLESNSAKTAGTTTPNHLPPKFDKVSFGIVEYHPIPDLSDMWIDDIRVSSQKIGCKN